MKKIININRFFLVIIFVLINILFISCNSNENNQDIDPSQNNDNPIIDTDDTNESTFENVHDNKKYDFIISSSSYNLITNVELSLKINDFINSDFNKYNPSFAMFSLLAVLNSHNNCLVKEKNSTNNLENNNKEFFNNIGFNYVEEYFVKPSDDLLDTTNMLIASGIVDNNNIIINVSYLGTDGSDEWISNFDIGANTSSYYELTNNHPSWNNKLNHKGFDVAAKESIKYLNNFIDKYYKDTKKNITYCINGYSRGAAIGNIAASTLIDDNKKVFAYTFATPQTTTSSSYSDKKYQSIFNIVNSDDLVPLLPPTTLGFNRFGQTIKSSIKDKDENLLEYKNLTNNEYGIKESFESIVDVLSSICINRDNIYEIDKENLNKYESEIELLAVSNHDQRLNNLKNNGLDKFIYISDVIYNSESNKYEYYYSYAPCLLISILPNIITNPNNSFKYLTLFDSPSYYNLITELLKLSSFSTSLFNPHLPPSYLIILNEINKISE